MVWRDYSGWQKAGLVVGVAILAWLGVAVAANLLLGASGSGSSCVQTPGGPPCPEAVNPGIPCQGPGCPGGLPANCLASLNGFTGCVLFAIAGAPGYLWGLIAGYVSNFVDNYIVQTFQTILNDGYNALSSVLNAILAPILIFVADIQAIFVSFFGDVSAVAQPLGPLAPVLVVSVSLLVILGAIIVFYYVAIVLFAAFRTAFNLL